MKKTHRRPVIAAAAGALLALALSGCGGGTLLSDDNRELVDLERNRALWRNAAVRRYAFTARYSEQGTPNLAFQSTVLSGSVLSSSASVEATGAERDATPLTSAYGTVEQMFETIEDAAEDGDETLEVDYDVTDGHPVSIATGTASSNDDRPLVRFSVISFGAQD